MSGDRFQINLAGVDMAASLARTRETTLRLGRAVERRSRREAVGALRDLAEFIEQQLAGLDRDDGLHSAVLVDEFRALCDRALERSKVHAADYGELARLEGGGGGDIEAWERDR